MYKKNAFTLIELMIVMAVIAILIGIILPTIGGFREEANISRARGDLATLRTAMESYYIHNNNSYPAALTSLPGSQPRIVANVPNDPFDPGNQYVLVIEVTPGNFYAIYSDGPGGDGSVTVNFATGVVTHTVGTSGRGPVWVSNGDEMAPADKI